MPLNFKTTRQLIDAIAHQTAITDMDGTILMTNEAWEEYSRLNNGDPGATGSGANYFDVLRQSGDKQTLVSLKKVLTGKMKEFSSIYPCHTADREQYFKMQVSPVKEDGKITALMIGHVDTTSLIVNQNTLSDILESMTDGFLTISPDMVITYVNQEAVRLLSNTRENLAGRSVYQAFSMLSGTQFEQGFRKALSEKNTVRIEEYFAPRKIWFQVHFYPRKHGGMAVYFQSINERKMMEQQLIEHAYYDSLTGLPNRKMLENTLEDMMEEADAARSILVYFIDMDGFKNINDLYGHNTGDKLLKELGDRLKKVIQAEGHFISRFGGDEFVALYGGPPSTGASKQFTKALFNEIGKPFKLDGYNEVSVTASIGASRFPEDGTTVEELLSMADTAMYESKDIQGNKLTFFHHDMRENLVYRVNLLDKLKKALAAYELDYVFQPQVRLSDGQIGGVEVLTRWTDPDYGSISPGVFVPLAEESGLIREMTENQIAAVFPYVRQWREETAFAGTLSINISTALIENRDFIQFFLRELAAHDFSQGSIEVELTESVKLLTSPVITEHLWKLKRAGVLIAIDDFGTGYSNFSYLSQFPLDKVKLDKSFIRHIKNNSRVEEILSSLIYLARKLGYNCTAEGVETEEQMAFLKKHGCDCVQGFYCYRPLEAEKVYNLFKSGTTA